ESREDNNQLIVVVAAENRSDLVATSLSADPAAALANATLNLTLSVTNRGVPFSGDIDAWIYLDDGISTGASNRTAVWNISLDLLRGEKANFSANWTIPAALFVGNHTLRAFLDPLGAVDEVSEANNNGTVQIIVLSP